jgi:pimeloyl-ACP methyl ester carboxylesterase
MLANAADIAGLKAFLKRQAERYDTLAAPIVVIPGDRDRVVSPRHHAMRLAAAVPGASAICCTTPPPTGSSPRSRS